MATLTRSTSGLKQARDEFNSDTSSQYSGTTGNTLTIGSGIATGTANSYWMQNQWTSNCVTVRTKRLSGGRCSGVFLGPDTNVDTAADRDGYRCMCAPTTSYWSLAKYNDGTQDGSVYNSSSSDIPSVGSYGIIRAWQDGSNTYAYCGTTYPLSITLSVADVAYTVSYTGIYLANETSPELDWVEYRTGVTITCSGLSTGWYLDAYDGTTHLHSQESSGTATVDISTIEWPLTEVSVWDGHPFSGGTELIHALNTTYSDMGGGDAFVYATGPIAPTIDASQSGSNIVVSWS